MTGEVQETFQKLVDIDHLTTGERHELAELGILSPDGGILPPMDRQHQQGWGPVKRRPICASSVLNEAFDYFPTPSSFSRGLRAEMGDHDLLFISGTASVDEDGGTIHVGDFRAQCWRTYRNITTLLNSENASWKDIVKCTCYLRDIERDYRDFNEVRTAFFHWLGLSPLPASVGIQARLCREDLLVEIEALAMVKKTSAEH